MSGDRGRPPPGVADRTPLRAIVVEDSDDDFALIIDVLTAAGYSVHAEQVVDEAGLLAALHAGPWDVVISDHRLPRFSAHAALATVQASGRDVPFLIVSGWIDEETAVEAMLAGADDYISKTRLSRLVPAVERAIRTARVWRERHQAEERLRDSEARLRALVANLPGLLIQMELRGDTPAPRFTFATECAFALLGLEPEAIVANPESLIDQIAPEDRASLRAALGAAARKGGEIDWEGRACGPSGDQRWLRFAARPRVVGGQRQGIWDGLITDITAQKVAEAALVESREELRRLSAHLERAKERERARIAREIHDDIGGTLTGMSADLAWLKRRFAGDPEVAAKLAGMAALLDSAMLASVRIVRDLRPQVLELGFVAAMQWLAQDFHKRTGIDCEMACDDEDIALAPERATAVFRIFQELLTNIVKHAAARSVKVQLLTGGGQIVLEVVDDGRGIAEGDAGKPGAFGIRGMLERARELHGDLEIGPAPRGGTRATLVVPLEG